MIQYVPRSVRTYYHYYYYLSVVVIRFNWLRSLTHHRMHGSMHFVHCISFHDFPENIFVRHMGCPRIFVMVQHITYQPYFTQTSLLSSASRRSSSQNSNRRIRRMLLFDLSETDQIPSFLHIRGIQVNVHNLD